MTGYGKALLQHAGKSITIEVRSLNSKQFELNLRLPASYREKEMDIRALVSQRLERGKVDLAIQLENNETIPTAALNTTLALAYYRQLKELGAQMPEARLDDLLSILVRMPEVLKTEKEVLDPEEWAGVNQGIVQALEEADRFRLAEGGIMQQDIALRLGRIESLLDRVGPLEPQRIAALRAKFVAHLEELLPARNYDENRLEQELVYYIEKLDITEEKVRLAKHCEYFTETMAEPDPPGKKLAFISQEIGREINTLGSKANDAQIQKLVVQMKDELEKIKEQLGNIL